MHMAVAETNKRVTSTLSKDESDILEKLAKQKGCRSIGEYLVRSARIVSRMELALDIEKELGKPLR